MKKFESFFAAILLNGGIRKFCTALAVLFVVLSYSSSFADDGTLTNGASKVKVYATAVQDDHNCSLTPA